MDKFIELLNAHLTDEFQGDDYKVEDVAYLILSTAVTFANGAKNRVFPYPQHVQLVFPGQAVTRDYRPDRIRVNVQYLQDDTGRVRILGVSAG